MRRWSIFDGSGPEIQNNTSEQVKTFNIILSLCKENEEVPFSKISGRIIHRYFV